MKKLTLLAIAVLLAFGVQAQTAKGTFVLTGKAGYIQSQNKTDRHKNNPYSEFEQYNYTIAPAIGYFIKDNLEIGATAHTYQLDYKDVNYYEGGSNTWNQDISSKGVSVYARQYKYLTEKLALHGTLAAGISNQYHQSTSTSFGPYAQSTKYKFDVVRLNGSLSPGLTFFASNKIGFETSLGALVYNRNVTEWVSEYHNYAIPNDSPQLKESTSKRNALQLDFSSMNLNFGLSYFLGR